MKKTKKIIIFSIIILILILIIFLAIFFFKKRLDTITLIPDKTVIENGKYVYDTFEFYIENEEKEKIFGKLYKPKRNEKMPIVIYSHGLGATYRACTDYAEILAEYGVASYCIDFRGGSDRSKSDGLTTDMSILTEVDDLKFVYKQILDWDFVDTNNVVLMGSSQGGAVSAIVSSELNDELKGLVLLYPALTMPDVFRERFEDLDSVAEEFKLTDKITVGKKYFSDVRDLYIMDMLSSDTKQILIIHGTEDKLVSIDVSKRAIELYPNSKLYEIEGAGHGFEDDQFDKAMEYILEYLKKIEIVE